MKKISALLLILLTNCVVLSAQDLELDILDYWEKTTQRQVEELTLLVGKAMYMARLAPVELNDGKYPVLLTDGYTMIDLSYVDVVDNTIVFSYPVNYNYNPEPLCKLDIKLTNGVAEVYLGDRYYYYIINIFLKH